MIPNMRNLAPHGITAPWRGACRSLGGGLVARGARGRTRGGPEIGNCRRRYRGSPIVPCAPPLHATLVRHPCAPTTPLLFPLTGLHS